MTAGYVETIRRAPAGGRASPLARLELSAKREWRRLDGFAAEQLRADRQPARDVARGNAQRRPSEHHAHAKRHKALAVVLVVRQPLPSNAPTRRAGYAVVGERRVQLLSAGLELLGQRPHDQVSINEIARAAGVSKGLLYHYFRRRKTSCWPSCARPQISLASSPHRILPCRRWSRSTPASTPSSASWSTMLPAYYTIFRTRGGDDEDIRAALEEGRELRLETAVHGWSFFVEGAVLRWLERGGLERDELRRLLRLVLLSSLRARENARLAYRAAARLRSMPYG